MNERRKMQAGDWFNAVVNLMIGVFLGMAIDGLLQLATTAVWPLAVIIPLLFAGFFLIVLLFEKLIDLVVDRHK